MRQQTADPVPVLALFACLTLAFPARAEAQFGRFVNLGAGVSLPAGARADAMSRGWLIQAMGGVTLPDGIVNFRVGGTYGRNGAEGMEGGATTLVSVMAGVMLTPIAIGSFVPYGLVDAGLLRATYRGSATSFAWQVGGGLLLQTGTAGWFVEYRYMQARRAGEKGAMVPLAAGVRFMWS